MANQNHLSSVTVYTVTNMNNTYYNQFFGIGQQAINFNLYQIGLPADDPVYTLKKVMEEMNFSGLTARYSTKGRKGYNPIMKFAVMTYANMRGVKAVDQIVELCERDIAFIWLSNGKRPQRDAFYGFINNKLSGEILDYLHYQFIRSLQREGLVTLESLFIDGTKIEANANRYIFVWCGSINYRLAGLLDKVNELYSRYNTLIPVLEKHKETFGKILEEVTADSGYSSEQNLSYLEEEGIESYIKLQTHEKMKTRAYKNEIGRHYNMEKVKEGDTHYYLCSDGRKLIHERTETRRQNELNRTFEVYACSDCSGCTLKAQCLYQYDEEKDINKNKIMKVNENWEELKAKSHENIQSEKGILNRQIRSIQTEGHFGDIKENDRFRRFNYRSFKKVYKEFIIYLFGRNLNKYHKFIKGEIKEFKGKTAEIAA